MPFVVDDLGTWLIGKLADAGSKKLFDFVLGTEQERALHRACQAALACTAGELRPGDAAAADEVATVIGEVFKTPALAPPDRRETLLEELQDGIAAQLAVLDDRDITTEPGWSSADALGIPAGVVAETLAGHLLQEIVSRGVRGGPLEPMANRLNHDRTYLQALCLEGKVEHQNKMLVSMLAILEQASAVPALPAVPAQVDSTTRAPARSAYLEQVKWIAPVDLRDRESELAELAAFSIEPDRGPYVWWQAPRFAGKSALMSWFVLHPPAGVRAVSFFITGRFPGEDDRTAFTYAVTEQLAGLLGQPMPLHLREITRGYHLRQMLSQASEACRQQGEHLVLVVDGIDEDRGIGPEPDAHSIVAMLPAQPPAGLRIVVAGRPHPPLPDDVPDNHPLRQRGTVRSLDTSPWAEVAGTDMRFELKRLLHGDQTARELLGILTAAGGGLSARDLAELTGDSEYFIRARLDSAEGRALDKRPSRWQPAASPDVYIFGHEELLETSAAAFGQPRLSRFREGLHVWADRYRQQGWPPGTPEYLLRGYLRLLRTGGDAARLLACATDRARQDRLRDLTGGDAAGLMEIRRARELMLLGRGPDLAAMARLAISQDRLAQRNQAVPPALPAAWVILGERRRAEALARGIADPGGRARALSALAATAAKSDSERATALAVEAEATACLASTGVLQDFALRAVTDDLLQAGLWEQAEQAANSIRDSRRRSEALSAVAARLAAVDKQRALAVATGAEEAALAVHDLDRTPTLLGVAEMLVSAELLEPAERVARSIGGYPERARALSAVAAGLATTDRPRAMALIDKIDRIAWLCGPEEGIVVSAALSVALAKVSPTNAAAQGDENEQEEADEQETEEDAGGPAISPGLTRAFAEAASMLADVDREHALALADNAVQTAQTIPDRSDRSLALYGVAEHLIVAKFWASAEQAAAGIENEADRSRALRHLAEALAAAGQIDHGQEVARGIRDTSQALQAQRALAEGLIAAGDLEEAEAVAQSIPASYSQASALSKLAAAFADVDRDRALRLAAQAEQSCRAAPTRFNQSQVLSSVAEALAATDPARALAVAAQAERIARSHEYPPPYGLARAVTAVAAALSAVDRERAMDLAAEAVHTASAIPADVDQLVTLQAVTEALTEARLWEPAAQAARSIRDRDRRADALTAVAIELAKFDPDRALAAVEEAAQVARANPYTLARDWTLRRIAQRLADGKFYEPAAQVARSIDDTDERADALFAVAAALAKTDRHTAYVLTTEAELAAEKSRRWRDPTGTRTAQATALAKGDRSAVLAMAAASEHAARGLSDVQEKSEKLAAVTKLLIAAGSWERAEEVARNIPDIEHRDRSLSAVAEGLAAAELWEPAERLARDITHLETRDRVLCTLMDGLIAACRTNSAQRPSESGQDPRDSLELRDGQARRLVADLLGSRYWLQHHVLKARRFR